jgi:HSP20 family protein
LLEGRVRLRGNRAVPMWTEGTENTNMRVRMHLMEIDHGSFARDVELPEDVHRDHINAHYRDGMLWIELPRKH